MAEISVGLLAFIGIGSTLFHSFEELSSAVADVLPIMVFLRVMFSLPTMLTRGFRFRYSYVM